MRKFLKKHLFWIIIDIVFTIYFLFLALVFFAPRVDMAERGFIPCTKKMINDMLICQQNKTWCTVKFVVKNNICDFKVVKEGFRLWLDGKQERPWSNYYFEPVLEEPETEDEELKAYYQEHLDLFSEMEELNKNRIELEKKLKEAKEEVPALPEKNEISKKEKVNDENNNNEE